MTTALRRQADAAFCVGRVYLAQLLLQLAAKTEASAR